MNTNAVDGFSKIQELVGPNVGPIIYLFISYHKLELIKKMHATQGKH